MFWCPLYDYTPKCTKISTIFILVSGLFKLRQGDTKILLFHSDEKKDVFNFYKNLIANSIWKQVQLWFSAVFSAIHKDYFHKMLFPFDIK